MTLSIIGLILALIALTINIAIVIVNYKNDKSSYDYTFDDEKYVKRIEIKFLENKINRIESNTLPLVTKYQKEQKQKLIETRKAHWKSFNTWKFHKGMFEENFEKDKDNTVCGECLSDGLKLTVDYKTSHTIDRFGLGGRVENDYPISAEQKCTVCNHVADKWEYKE
ncbi:hypothetical protein PYH69_09620 [Mammaliicoccus lentus]|uniref:Uncharacterized protein n=1 Tax=Mammaliicoccus lentus TaxID=42858 RepID=A0AAX3W166_MAMLE|nr:hypothetical protein [Mammaliicoccus lentus]WHI59014.1 hypothetical protein PYH69_09620 [Mammaliicoccus lentus]